MAENSRKFPIFGNVNFVPEFIYITDISDFLILFHSYHFIMWIQDFSLLFALALRKFEKFATSYETRASCPICKIYCLSILFDLQEEKSCLKVSRIQEFSFFVEFGSTITNDGIGVDMSQRSILNDLHLYSTFGISINYDNQRWNKKLQTLVYVCIWNL